MPSPIERAGAILDALGLHNVDTSTGSDILGLIASALDIVQPDEEYMANYAGRLALQFEFLAEALETK